MIDPDYDILNAINDGVLIIDRDHKVVFANRSFLELNRTAAEDIVGTECYKILHMYSAPCPTQAAERHQCVLETVFKTGTPVTLEHHQHILPDGSKRYFQISASPLKNDQGEVVRMLQLLTDVTKQHELKKSLSTSYLELERIFHSAPFTISYLDRQMRVIRLNPAMEKFIGRPTEEVKGKYCYDVWGQYAKDETQKGRKRICDNSSTIDCLRDKQNHVYQRQVGDIFFEVLSVPVLDSDGTVIGAMEIGNDITQQKLIEKRLRESEERYRSLIDDVLDTSAVGIFILDADFKVVWINRALERYFGLQRDTVIGKDKRQLIRQRINTIFENPDSFVDKVFATYDDNTYIENFECHVLAGGDRQERWLEHRSQPITTGLFAGGRIEHYYDITDRKQIEERLRESESFATTVFDSIQDGISVLDPDLNIIKVNHAMQKWYAHQLPLAGKKCYAVYHGRSKPCIVCPTRRALKSRKLESDEIPYIGENGKQKGTLELFAYPMQNKVGKVIGVVEYVRDITEHKLAEQRLQQVIQADKLASLGEVVAGVAHEINNPNSFISYNIPLLEEIWQVVEPLIDRQSPSSQGLLPANLTVDECCQDIRDSIEAIKIGSERINRVVSNLKDFVRVDENAHFEPLLVNEIMEKTYSIVGAQIRKATTDIEFKLAENLPPVMGHFQKLEQVMANLLINAGHALKGKSAPKISIATRYIDRLQSVAITIEDNGLGMTAETKSRIFEPFFTTRRDSGGTGLGLSVSHGLILEHKGTIGILSRPGIGTRFTIFLPKDGQVSRTALQPTVLFVDEENNLPSLTAEFLAIQGGAIETVSRQTDVIGFLAEHPEVDIVFCTVKSPHIEGWDLLEKIKMQFPLLSVVLYAESLEDLTGTPTGSQPDCLLQKPFRQAQLLDCLNSIERIQL